MPRGMKLLGHLLLTTSNRIGYYGADSRTNFRRWCGENRQNQYYIHVDTGIIRRVLRIIIRISTRKTKMMAVKRNRRVPINFISINRGLDLSATTHICV